MLVRRRDELAVRFGVALDEAVAFEHEIEPVRQEILYAEVIVYIIAVSGLYAVHPREHRDGIYEIRVKDERLQFFVKTKPYPVSYEPPLSSGS